MEDEDVGIEPSDLGTKDFWDRRYEMELTNFKSHGDEGEVWFGASAENRIVKYLLESKMSKNAEILDLGCGNGSVLRKLRKKGFQNLTGVDYCETAVEMSKCLAEAKTDEAVQIRFEQLDIVEPKKDFFNKKFQVILDKGTWDAMSLSEEKDFRLSCYRSFLGKSLEKSGIFVIFSCNFTLIELKHQFGDETNLKFLCEVPAEHSFTFGGKKGVTSTGVVFQRNA